MILIMLGAPGTGKGTVAGILSKELGIVSVSSGDIFRKAISENKDVRYFIPEKVYKYMIDMNFYKS